MAYDSLTKEQVAKIEETTPILVADINTIGLWWRRGVRCMMAEIFEWC